MIPEKRLNPVVDMVWYIETRELVKDSTVTDTVECLGKIQCIDDDIRIALKMVNDCMEEVYKGCCCGGTWVKGELVREAESWRRRLEGWINIVLDNNALHYP